MTESQPSSLLPRLTSTLLATATDLPARLAESIRRRVPSYRQPSPVTDQELLDSCAAHVGFISSLGVPDPERDKTVRVIGASRARANFPLPDVLDAIRVGSEFIWGEIVDHAQASGTASDAELVTVAGQVWSMSDEFVGLMSAGYREEEELRLINGERERYALIDTVLSGHDQPNATLWQAVDRLGLPRDRPYVVVAVEAQGGGHVPTPRIDRRLLEDDMESAWLLRSDVELGIVSCLHEQIRFVRKSLQHYEVRAGISPVTEDFGHTPQAVRLARTSLAASDDGQVTFFSDSAIDDDGRRRTRRGIRTRRHRARSRPRPSRARTRDDPRHCSHLVRHGRLGRRDGAGDVRPSQHRAQPSAPTRDSDPEKPFRSAPCRRAVPRRRLTPTANARHTIAS